MCKNPGDSAPEEIKAIPRLNQSCWLSHVTFACLGSRLPPTHGYFWLDWTQNSVSGVCPGPGFQDLPWVTGSPGQ